MLDDRLSSTKSPMTFNNLKMQNALIVTEQVVVWMMMMVHVMMLRAGCVNFVVERHAGEINDLVGVLIAHRRDTLR